MASCLLHGRTCARPWGTAVLCLLGLRAPGLAGGAGRDRALVERLHFDQCLHRAPKVRGVALHNTSADRPRLTITHRGPFSAPRGGPVPAARESTCAVELPRCLRGPRPRTLVLDERHPPFEDRARRLRRAQVPECVRRPPAGSPTFSSHHGACVEEQGRGRRPPAPGQRCISGGSCFNGMCLGTARDCSDSNLCTADACDPGGGCFTFRWQCGARREFACKVAAATPRSWAASRPDAQDTGAA